MSFVNPRHSQSRVWRVLFFIAGISNFIRINGQFQLIPIEIFAVAIAVISLFTSSGNLLTVEEIRFLRFSNLFCVVSVTHQWLIDASKQIAMLETSKSSAQIIVLWALIRMAILFFRSDSKRFIYYVVGLQVSIILRLLLNPTIYMTEEPWKFAVGPVATVTIFLLFNRKNNKKFLVVGLIPLLILDLLLGARSLALFTIFTIALSFMKLNRNRKSILRFTLTIISIIVLFFCD